jgi:hypothetical protein
MRGCVGGPRHGCGAGGRAQGDRLTAEREGWACKAMPLQHGVCGVHLAAVCDSVSFFFGTFWFSLEPAAGGGDRRQQPAQACTCRPLLTRLAGAVSASFVRNTALQAVFTPASLILQKLSPNVIL